MRRCVSAKIVRYQPDGSGRDTFIQKFNGGFQSQQLLAANAPKSPSNPLNPQWRVGTAFIKSSFQKCHSYVKYRSDGSGRDSYIQNDNGGLYLKNHGKINLVRYLRNTTQPVRKVKPRGIFAQKLKLRAVLQRVQSARLSIPKTVPNYFQCSCDEKKQ